MEMIPPYKRKTYKETKSTISKIQINKEIKKSILFTKNNAKFSVYLIWHHIVFLKDFSRQWDQQQMGS